MDNEAQSFMQVMTSSRIRTAVLAVLVMLGVFLAAQTINSIKEFSYIGASPTYNAITVNGKGEVLVVPDIASFTFSVIEEAPDASSAQDAVAQKMESIISFVREQGVDERDIKTTSFNLYPRYEFREIGSTQIGFPTPPGERQLVGFEVNQSVQVKVRDTSKAGQLIAGVSELGAGSVGSLNFTVDDIDAIKAEAREKAIQDAKDRAVALADELGIRLGRVISYGESENPIYYGRGFDTAGIGGEGLSISSQEAVITEGENKITANVSVTYEIR